MELRSKKKNKKFCYVQILNIAKTKKWLVIGLVLLSGLAYAGWESWTQLTAPADGDILAVQDISDTTQDATGTAKYLTLTTFWTEYLKGKADALYQPLDTDLTTFAGITPSANVISFLSAADYAAMKALLDLEIGTDLQAYDVDLTTYAGITPSSNVQSLLGAASYQAFLDLLESSDYAPTGALDFTGASSLQMGSPTIPADEASFTSNDTSAGIKISGINAGETIAIGNLVYLDATADEWMLADADASGKWPAIAVAVSAGRNGEAITVMTKGVLRHDDWNWSAANKTLYLSDTAGGLTETAPSDTDDAQQPVGLTLNDDVVYFDFKIESVARLNIFTAADPLGQYLLESAVEDAAGINTGTATNEYVTADALAGSNAFTKDVGWTIYDSDVAIATGDGKQFFAVPASMNGMNLVDVTASVANLNSATGGTTTVVIRRVRGATAADMTSTGVTVDYNAYTASDETVDTSNDDLQTGDKIFVDVDAVTTGAVQKGLSVTCLFRLP